MSGWIPGRFLRTGVASGGKAWRHGQVSFDRLAPIYLLMEKVAAGGKMQRCRLAHLDRIRPPRRVLLAGEGHGRFLPVCLERFPEAEITVIDYSAGMLARAKANLPASVSARVHFLHQDILSWQPEAGVYDLIVTHFFLDCFTAEQIENVVATLSRAATDEADWLLADFRIDEPGLKGVRARWIVVTLYRFFRFFTRIPARVLSPPDLAMIRSGFTLEHEELFEWGLLKSQWWQRRS